MKKTMLFMMLTIVLGLFWAASALAGPPKARQITRTQAVQQERIQQGVKQGRLTRTEVKTLRKEQRQIGRIKQRFLKDGTLSKPERRKLAALQRQADTHIKRLNRNRNVQPRLRAKHQQRRLICSKSPPGQGPGPRV